ncbi:uncharacterized [Tachysurus ichikawai]
MGSVPLIIRARKIPAAACARMIALSDLLPRRTLNEKSAVAPGRRAEPMSARGVYVDAATQSPKQVFSSAVIVQKKKEKAITEAIRFKRGKKREQGRKQ